MKLTMPTKLVITLAGVLALLVLPARAEPSITFCGQAQTEDLTDIPWVLGSKMWGGVQTNNGTGNAFSEFTSLIGLNPTLITLTSGNLELTSYLSPGPSSPGYEVYTESDASIMPLRLFYDGALLASGTLSSIKIDVDNSSDATAVGTAFGQFSSAGANPTFFNELMLLSGNTGLVRFDTSTFTPVNNFGLFNTSTVMTVVPEPATAGLLAMGFVGIAGWRRRR